MRIATWNINGLRARLEYVQHWLRAVEPDVVGLQELKMADEQFPADVFSSLGYRSLSHGQKGWNGVAILAREEITPVQVGLPDQVEQGARLLVGDVAGLRFGTVYIPNGKTVEHPDFQAKLAFFDSLTAFLEHQDRASPFVLGGDFNLVPAPIDSWNEEALSGRIFHTAEERDRYRALLELGLKDLWRELRPEDPGHSWWDYRAGAFHKRQGLRIDLLLATSPVVERARAAHLERTWRKKVEGLTPSDHAPVWVDLG
ncbi:MAG: exodeoxyribonuclease III [Sandaracinaceae bacterium]